MPSSSAVRLVRLSRPQLIALADGVAPADGVELPFTTTPFLLDEAWLWRLRRDQVADAEARSGPEAADVVLDWIARVAVTPEGAVVGHVGFHGPPEPDGTVEVAYAVDPAHRRRGYGRALLEAALGWARSLPEVSAVRASVSPQNLASLATIAPLRPRFTGIADDPDDGPELVFLMDPQR